MSSSDLSEIPSVLSSSFSGPSSRGSNEAKLTESPLNEGLGLLRPLLLRVILSLVKADCVDDDWPTQQFHLDEGVITIGAISPLEMLSKETNERNVQHVARSSGSDETVAWSEVSASKSSFFLIFIPLKCCIMSTANEVGSSFSVVSGWRRGGDGDLTVNRADKLSLVKSKRFRGGGSFGTTFKSLV